MAGRGRDAVLPAWMKTQGDAAPSTTTAPGAAPSPTPPSGIAAGAPPLAPPRPAAAPGAIRPTPYPIPRGPPAFPIPRPTPAGAAPPLDAWTAHTDPQGRTYYFNRATGQSSWVRPPSFQAAAAGAAQPGRPTVPTTAASAAATTTTQRGSGGGASDWGKFTAPDGRVYYYNRITKESRWTLPEELAASKAVSTGPPGGRSASAAGDGMPSQGAAAQLPGSSGGEGRSNATSAVAPGVHVVPPGVIQTGPTPYYATPKEAKEAFWTLLRDARILSTMAWETCMPLIAGDRRFGALSKLGDRKAAFHEWIQKRTKEQAEEARQRRIQAREKLYELLVKSFQSIIHSYGPLPTFSELEQRFEIDQTWTAVEDTRDREEVYSDWLEDTVGRIIEAHAEDAGKKKEAVAALLRRLPWIASDATWSDAQVRLASEPAFQNAGDVERLQAWQERMAQLDEEDKEKARRKGILQKAAEREARCAFKDMLERHAEQGRIHAKSRWKEYRTTIASESALAAVEANTSGSRPKELFMDMIAELEERHEAHKDAIKAARHALRDRDVPVPRLDERQDATNAAGTNDDNTTKDNDGINNAQQPQQAKDAHALAYDGWRSAFLAALDALEDAETREAAIKVPESSLRLYFDEIVGHAARAAKKARADFVACLRRRLPSSETAFDTAQEMCGEEEFWKAVTGGDEERKTLFMQWKAQAIAKEAKDAELRQQRKTAADKKRKHRHDDGEDADGKDGGAGGRGRARSRSAEVSDRSGGARDPSEGGGGGSPHHRRRPPKSKRSRSRSRSRSVEKRGRKRGRHRSFSREGGSEVSSGLGSSDDEEGANRMEKRRRRRAAGGSSKKHKKRKHRSKSRSRSRRRQGRRRERKKGERRGAGSEDDTSVEEGEVR